MNSICTLRQLGATRKRTPSKLEPNGQWDLQALDIYNDLLLIKCNFIDIYSNKYY